MAKKRRFVLSFAELGGQNNSILNANIVLSHHFPRLITQSSKQIDIFLPSLRKIAQETNDEETLNDNVFCVLFTRAK